MGLHILYGQAIHSSMGAICKLNGVPESLPSLVGAGQDGGVPEGLMKFHKSQEARSTAGKLRTADCSEKYLEAI
jgi:hypothetical protein